MTEMDDSSQKMQDPTDGLSSWERTGYLTLLIVFFAFGLFDHSLWSSNDAREGSMIAEMYRTGTWVTPMFNGQNYLEKPPLLHWTSLTLCHMFGRMNEGLVRLPAAMFGFGAMFIIYLWGRRLGRERAAFAGIFMCSTSTQYLEYSKIVLTDTTLTFMVLLSLYIFWEAYTSQTFKPLKYACFLLVSALSFYAKGLLGPGFIWVPATFFLIYNKRWKLLLGLGCLFVPVFIVSLIPWTFALWKTGGAEFLKTVFWANQLGRFFTFSDISLPVDPYFVHKEPFYYYLTSLPVSLLPWTLLVPFAMLYWFRSGRGLDNQLHIFLRIILASMLLILHVSSAKAGCYIIPTLPIIFLMTAIWSEDIMTERNSRYGNWAILITTCLVSFISLLIPLAYILLFAAPSSFFDRYFDGVNILRVAGTQALYAGLVMAFTSLLLFTASFRELWTRYIAGFHVKSWLTIPAVTAILLILNIEAILPAADYQHTFKPFIRLVRYEKENKTKIAFAGKEEKYIGAFTFYLKSNIDVIPSPDKLAAFLLESDTPAAVILKKKEMKKWLEVLPECRFKVLKSDHKGYKSDYFRLVLNDKETKIVNRKLTGHKSATAELEKKKDTAK